MLLRSTSTPVLRSWTPQCTRDYSSSSSSSSPELDPAFQLKRTRSISLTTSSSHFNLHSDDPTKKMTTYHVLSEKNSRTSENKKKPVSPNRKSTITVDQENGEEMKPSSGSSIQKLFSTSGLGESMDEEKSAVMEDDNEIQTLVMGGAAGNNGGRIGGGCGWKGSGGGGHGGGGSGSSEHGSDSTDAYYRKMIEANPGNALLLGNYARYLKEVKKNMAKAEEYCGRAILANSSDGGVLSLYADLIWEMNKDASRAETYYEQAVKSSPDDCYVLASYARFLWDADEEDDDQDGGESNRGNSDRNHHHDSHHHRHSSPPSFIWEARPRPITAAT